MSRQIWMIFALFLYAACTGTAKKPSADASVPGDADTDTDADADTDTANETGAPPARALEMFMGIHFEPHNGIDPRQVTPNADNFSHVVSLAAIAGECPVEATIWSPRHSFLSRSLSRQPHPSRTIASPATPWRSCT
jgi:hypothetical protein